MPELPEVETVRARLEPKLVGRRFEHVGIFDPRLTRPADPAGVAAELEGERVAALDRRGKYLIVRFESGRVLLIHLRMTGQLLHANGGRPPAGDVHRRAVVKLDDGSDVVYRDVRRFGTWQLLDEDDLLSYLAQRIGREPLVRSFTSKRLAEALEGRRAPLKSALLDQRRLAGVGNIYADEALWRARLHPLRPAGELSAEEIAALHRGIRAALRAGIARQGATLSNYRTPDGSPGRMQEEFRVYGREGEPCERCGTPIEKIRAGGRGTWYCPSCQR
ncbi:MAG: bifunctional DNA-formamidopyrimidine glycosylase/DNA-(apurinic or apyrimidinic site) lyase [Actinobacteria bacterium]|nr:MAG: bifunctional DNA-formamidopyrimidine glycosylase/DNA-(apurinic or apyrimidinic site) lyase [Actinomycetota bacterium]